MNANTPTMYDPPEARQGSSSTADDIWALGVSLFEALTRRPPSGLGEPREAIVLPGDFSPAFREVVVRCLSPSPQDRPSVTELVAWARGGSLCSAPAATTQSAALVQPQPRTPEPGSANCTPAADSGSGTARAVHGTVREDASLAYRDARSGHDSGAGLDRSARVKKPSHARSSSTSCSGSRRITVTDSGRRRTRGSERRAPVSSVSSTRPARAGVHFAIDAR
jgi:serine/threonine protein kinase